MALSQHERQRIHEAWFVADRPSIAAVVALTGCSEWAARRYRPSDEEIAQKRDAKKAALEAQAEREMRDLVIEVRRTLLLAMADPRKIEQANVQQLATSFGILTDKQLLEDGKATERHEHVHDWRAQVAEVAAARGLDPAEVIAATEAMIAERHGLAD